MVADRYCKKRSKKREKISNSALSLVGKVDSEVNKIEEEEEEIVIDAYSTSCKRQCSEKYHENGKDQATDEVAKLYEIVKNMPEGPQKTHFMKKVSRYIFVCVCVPLCCTTPECV